MRKEMTYEQGPKGLGELRVLKDGVLQIINDEGIVYNIQPKNVLTPIPELKEGDRLTNIHFKLNTDEDSLYELRPYGEPKGPNWFVVRYKKAPHREGEEPDHYTKEGRKVTYWDEKERKNKSFYDPEAEQWNALVEIVDGQFKGCEIKVYLGYFFFEDPTQEGATMFRGKGGLGTFTDVFMTLAGYDWSNDIIPFSNNVVPEVDRILQERSEDHLFRVRIRKGYIKEAQGVEEGYLEYLKSKEEETVEEE